MRASSTAKARCKPRASRAPRPPARRASCSTWQDRLPDGAGRRTHAGRQRKRAGGGPPNSAATRSPCSWRWAAAGRTGANPTAGIESAVDAGRCYDRPVSPDPATAGASLQAFRLHGRPAALPLFPAPAARLHCAAERLLRHAQPAKPPERVTGAGGSMLRYSSKQTTIELTPAERAAVTRCACAPIRVRRRATATPAGGLEGRRL